ncbi:vWA domain-containing protein [Pallidibacillus thermolactis]|jgi:hypothetical protein|uniref:hypothetical protein n=1 Tax=Pallidibacillus thermolactis TaxID=251051 RepID=UPI0021D8215E|nr:hypothetical protein [Pallidibacillus thermolactis]
MMSWIGWLIIACEIGFWVFVLAGLVTRYIFKKKKLSMILFICTPLIDLVLLFATYIDLVNGAVAEFVHGLAAIYIGISVVYGKQMIAWVDKQFAYRFSGGERPVKKKLYGMEYAREERKGWYRHFFAYIIGASIIGMILLSIGFSEQTAELIRPLNVWTVVIVIDFLISFSYTVFPKRAND